MSSYLDRIFIVHKIAMKVVIFCILSLLANILNLIILSVMLIQSPFEYIITGDIKNMRYGFEVVKKIERFVFNIFG